MIIEFLLRTCDRELLRGETNEWVKLFLAKFQKESTRTEKCRLVASIERFEFWNKWKARDMRFFKIGDFRNQVQPLGWGGFILSQFMFELLPALLGGYLLGFIT